MTRLAFLLTVCLIIGATPVAARGGSQPPRVFVYTAEAKDGVKTEEEQGRLDSVRDMRDALGRNPKIVLVSDATAAQVLVEVVGREKRDAPGGGFGGTVVTPPVETIVRLHVRFGDHETEIKGVGKGYWGRAAKDAAERLVKWITRVAATPADASRVDDDLVPQPNWPDGHGSKVTALIADLERRAEFASVKMSWAEMTQIAEIDVEVQRWLRKAYEMDA